MAETLPSLRAVALAMTLSTEAQALAALCVRLRAVAAELDDQGALGAVDMALDAQIGPLADMSADIRLGNVELRPVRFPKSKPAAKPHTRNGRKR